MIPALDSRRLPDHSTSPHNPQVEFIILAAYQVVIEKADPVKYFASPAAKINSIKRAFIVRVMTARTPDRKWRLKRRRNRAPHKTFSFSDPWTPNVVCMGFLEYSETLKDIIWGVLRMRVHANDDLPPRNLNGRVEPGCGDIPQVIDGF
jgi:hypothetical protein